MKERNKICHITNEKKDEESSRFVCVCVLMFVSENVKQKKMIRKTVTMIDVNYYYNICISRFVSKGFLFLWFVSLLLD